MPLLTEPALPPGSMAALPQPRIRADDLLLRPWQPPDRPVVVAAYADPAIQRWHCRSMSDGEAADWIAAWAGRWRGESGAGWAVRATPTAGTTCTSTPASTGTRERGTRGPPTE